MLYRPLLLHKWAAVLITQERERRAFSPYEAHCSAGTFQLVWFSE